MNSRGNWRDWAKEIEDAERGAVGGRGNGLNQREVGRSIEFLEDLLPTLDGSDLAHAHGTLAVLHRCLASGDTPEELRAKAEEHALRAVELGCEIASPYRFTAWADYDASRAGSVVLPATRIDVDERARLTDELGPKEIAVARSEVRWREACLLRAFDRASRAIELGPEDERNERALDAVVRAYRDLFDVREALARAPAVGVCVMA